MSEFPKTHEHLRLDELDLAIKFFAKALLVSLQYGRDRKVTDGLKDLGLAYLKRKQAIAFMSFLSHAQNPTSEEPKHFFAGMIGVNKKEPSQSFADWPEPEEQKTDSMLQGLIHDKLSRAYATDYGYSRPISSSFSDMEFVILIKDELSTFPKA